MALKIPQELLYTQDDEWVQVNGDQATIGITDYAQDSLSDIVYLELPGVNDDLGEGDTFGVVESVKAAADLLMPIGGKVTATNESVVDDPEVINHDPYGSWLIRIEIADSSQLEDLMDAEAYAEYCEGR